METVLLDEVVFTDYGQFDLVWAEDGGFDGDADRFFTDQVNGWVGAADPDGVYICLARRSGGSPIRLVLLDAEPSLLGDEFEDVVEVSTTVPDGAEPWWMAWAGESGGTLPGLPAGEYRMRVSAQGRDEGAEHEFAEDPVDRYVIQMWPAASRPDEILRSLSENGAYWHREWGSRR